MIAIYTVIFICKSILLLRCPLIIRKCTVGDLPHSMLLLILLFLWQKVARKEKHKHSNSWSVSLEQKVERKPHISEECGYSKNNFFCELDFSFCGIFYVDLSKYGTTTACLIENFIIMPFKKNMIWYQNLWNKLLFFLNHNVENLGVKVLFSLTSV